MVNVPFKICQGESVLKEFHNEIDNFLGLNLLCGEFHPALPGIPQYIHFMYMNYSLGCVSFSPCSLNLKLPESSIGLKLSVIEPGKFAHDL